MTLILINDSGLGLKSCEMYCINVINSGWEILTVSSDRQLECQKKINDFINAYGAIDLVCNSIDELGMRAIRVLDIMTDICASGGRFHCAASGMMIDKDSKEIYLAIKLRLGDAIGRKGQISLAMKKRSERGVKAGRKKGVSQGSAFEAYRSQILKMLNDGLFSQKEIYKSIKTMGCMQSYDGMVKYIKRDKILSVALKNFTGGSSLFSKS